MATIILVCVGACIGWCIGIRLQRRTEGQGLGSAHRSAQVLVPVAACALTLGIVGGIIDVSLLFEYTIVVHKTTPLPTTKHA